MLPDMPDVPDLPYELLQMAVEQSPASIVITDKEGSILYVNTHFTKLSGYSFDEAIGQNPRILKTDFHTPDYYKEMWNSLSQGNSWSGLFKNKNKAGEFYWERAHISPVINESGEITHFIAIKRDVTAEIDNKLISDRRGRLLNDIQVLSKTGGWEYDIESNEMFWTDELYELHGFERPFHKDKISESLKCYLDEDRDTVFRAFELCVNEGKDYDLVLRFQDVKGKKKWIRTKSRAVKGKKNTVIKVIGSVRDVTEEVLSQQKLKETSDRLNLALKGTQAGTWDWNIKTGVTIFNDRWAEMLGYTLEELGTTTIELWQKLTHPQDILLAEEQLNLHFTGKSDFYDTRFRMKHRNGNWIWVWDRGKVVEWDNDNNPVRMVGTHVVVTDWMVAEEKLKLSEKRYRDLFQESSDACILLKDDRITDCNQAAAKLLGFDKPEQLIQLQIHGLIPEYQPDGTRSADQIKRNLIDIFSKKSHKFEQYHKRKDGTLVPLEVSTTLLEDGDGEKLVYVIWRNVSARVTAESELRESLKEKETLLAEIHHRVKNNLAVISALMQLQMYSQDDPLAEEILSKSINRIRSIALIHEQLYKSERFSGISLKENIERQTEAVLDMYSDKLAARVHLELDLQEVTIDINKAMPMGLLLNEILNNTFKHAFKGREEGTISIFLDETKDDIHVIIKDDGVGFDPREFEDGSTSLGNSLIKSFLEQLNARYTLKSDSGTSYDIRFSKT